NQFSYKSVMYEYFKIVPSEYDFIISESRDCCEYSCVLFFIATPLYETESLEKVITLSLSCSVTSCFFSPFLSFDSDSSSNSSCTSLLELALPSKFPSLLSVDSSFSSDALVSSSSDISSFSSESVFSSSSLIDSSFSSESAAFPSSPSLDSSFSASSASSAELLPSDSISFLFYLFLRNSSTFSLSTIHSTSTYPSTY